jgi:prepilin-type N-terminal cleavage/methylation domain-containing protein
MMQNKTQYGFTLIEIIITIAVIVLIAVLMVTGFQNFSKSASLKVATGEVEAALVDARNKTLASEGDTAHGVYFVEDGFVSFEGTSYSSTSPTNVRYDFSGGVTGTTSFIGGGQSIVFERLTGKTNATGTIVLTGENGSTTRTITVYGTGFIER